MKRVCQSSASHSGGSVLVLYHQPPGEPMRPAIDSHLRVLANSDAGHQILYLNVSEGIPFIVRHLAFDVVILHTTLLCARWAWFFERVAGQLAWLRHATAVKIALPQDEYDHAEALDEWLESLGVSVVFSNFDESVRADLYPRMHKRAVFFQCLTGYIDEGQVAAQAGKQIAMQDRPLDIVYRAAHLPYWFGSQGQLKHRIADIVAGRALSMGYRCDISTDHAKTITSHHWFDFLGSSKTVIGCESGSSVLDPRGLIQKRIREMLTQVPSLTFDEVSSTLPAGWDSHRFFAIGPRHLEAIITRTCQVLVEGDYDGILVPYRHYLPLKRDFSNLDAILAMIKDDSLLEATANRAYEDILVRGKYSYAAFAKQIESVFPATLHARSHAYWWNIDQLIDWSLRVNRWTSPVVNVAAQSVRRAAHFARRLAGAWVRRVMRPQKV
jgi:hypothetical protein